MMEIAVENLQKKVPLNLPQIKKIAKQTLYNEGVRQAELSIVFVTVQKIIALNKKYLKRYHATDVLAFDLSEGAQEVLMGDIIISTDAAIANAKRFKTSIKHEIVLYVIHGILHLLGYDDHTPKDVKKMRAKEQELLKHFGVVKK